MIRKSIRNYSSLAGVSFFVRRSLQKSAVRRDRVSNGAALIQGAMLGAVGAILLGIAEPAMAANASPSHFEIKSESLSQALVQFGAQSGLKVVAPRALTRGKRAAAVNGDLPSTDALQRMLNGTNLTFTQDAGGTIALHRIRQARTSSSGAQIDSQYRLSTVIVTAEKRSQNLLQIPAPISVLNARNLARQGDDQLADYAASVPGLNLISSEPGQTSIDIRGVSTGFGYAVAATTAIYIDDSPFGSSTANALGSIASLDLDPATLQSVQVLRGPQGTLYGANSMGGLIRYVTVPPSLTKSSGQIELDGSAVDGGGLGDGIRAMWNGPLVTNKLGLIIDVYDRHDPGYIDNPVQHTKNVNSSHVAGGRVALLWKPTDRFSAELSALVQNFSTPNNSTVDVNANLTPINGRYQQVRYVGEDWITDDALYSLRASYDFSWATLTSITTYQKERVNTHTDFTNRFGPLLSSIIGIPNLGVVDHLSLADHKITQEIRIASSTTSKLEWLGGLYFTHEKSVQPENMTGFTLPSAGPVPGLQPLFVDPNHDSYKEYAGYGDLTYHVTSKFKILGGVRVTSDSESNVTPFSGLFNGPPAVAIANTSSRSTTYAVSPSYSIDKHQMVYARVATGFRPGGPTGLTTTSVYAGAPATYGPDTLTNYEVGYKADYPSQRMTVELSAFDIEWKKMQVLSEIGGFIITGNAADSRSSGLEFAWTWAPIPGLNWSANADYTHAYLTTNAPGIGGRAGDNLPAVPEFSAYVAGEYDFPLSSEMDALVGANFSYEGSRYSNFVTGLPSTMTRTVLPAYRTLNMHAGINYRSVTVEMYLKNVTNTYAFSEISSEAIDGFSPPLAAAVIQPRTVGLSISTKF